MDRAKRILTGNFLASEIKPYVLAEACIFWGLIFVAWLSYPAGHHYSIMSHTFSFLGSWDPQHNPDHWYFFSAGMGFWSVASIPLVFYHYRRFALISRWAAGVGSFFLLLGSIGTMGVACFPDARGAAIGTVEWTKIHEKVAVLVAIGYTLGLLWHGGMLLWDRAVLARGGRPTHFEHGRLAAPYLFWLAVTGAGVCNQVIWGMRYGEMKKAAALAGTQIRSSWGESLNTIWAFPLWENLVIYTLFIFLAWFTLAVPKEIPQRINRG